MFGGVIKSTNGSTLHICQKSDLDYIISDITLTIQSGTTSVLESSSQIHLTPGLFKLAEQNSSEVMSILKSVLIYRKLCLPEQSLQINGTIIEQVSSFFYLSFIMKDLSWSVYIENACWRSRRLIGFLYRSFRHGNSMFLAYLCKILVWPTNTRNCWSVWDLSYTNAISKLELLLSFAAKMVRGKWTGSSIVDLCQELDWPLLVSQKAYQKECHYRHILTGNLLIPDTVIASFKISQNEIQSFIEVSSH